jgi:flagella basal body P-ring formation protein FlgA
LTHAEVAAADIQSLDMIREIAEQGVRENASVPNGKLVVKADGVDPRLRLMKCPTRPIALLPTTFSLSARQTIGVRCTQNNAWTVYVPVTVETDLEVLLTRNGGQRGAHLVEADIERQSRRVPGFATSYVTDLSEYRERHLKRPLAPGTVLVADAFSADVLVKRGQQVTLVTSVGGIEVRAFGAAVSEGGTRDRIRVQNLSSLKIVEGVVESASLVRVGG